LSELELGQRRWHGRVRELLQQAYADIDFRDLGDRFEFGDTGALWVEISTSNEGRLAARSSRRPTNSQAFAFASDFGLASALAEAVGFLLDLP
jgi:hypothetical protein